MRAQMTIEAVLHWAFGVVRIDDLVRSGVATVGADPGMVLARAQIGLPRPPMMRSASDILAGWGALGCSVGGGGSDGAVAAAGCRSEEEIVDALLVYEEVVNLAPVLVTAWADGSAVWDADAIEAAGLVRVAGGLVRGDGGGWMRADALNLAAEVMTHARRGSRPALPAEADLCSDPSARALWHRDTADYRAWRTAIVGLAAAIGGQLQTVDLMPALPPAAESRAPRIIEDVSAKSMGQFAAKHLKKKRKKTV